RSHARATRRIAREVEEHHLVHAVGGWFAALAIAPGNEREEWPPGVADERHAASTYACDGLHRGIEPGTPAPDRADRGRFTNEQGPAVALPVQVGERFDDVCPGVAHAHAQTAARRRKSL